MRKVFLSVFHSSFLLDNVFIHLGSLNIFVLLDLINKFVAGKLSESSWQSRNLLPTVPYLPAKCCSFSDMSSKFVCHNLCKHIEIVPSGCALTCPNYSSTVCFSWIYGMALCLQHFHSFSTPFMYKSIHFSLTWICPVLSCVLPW